MEVDEGEAVKKILITGANSYVGKSVREYLEKWPDRYSIDALSVRESAWKEKCFADYDTVYHVAGLAHSDV